MKLIVCLDDQNGMLFNCRRQSRDEAVVQRILALAKEQGVWMNPYSANLFPPNVPGIHIINDPLSGVSDDHWVFCENSDVTPYVQQIRQLMVFRWNRIYPADLFFPMESFKDQLKPVSAQIFSGKSHATITEELYTL